MKAEKEAIFRLHSSDIAELRPWIWFALAFRAKMAEYKYDESDLQRFSPNWHGGFS